VIKTDIYAKMSNIPPSLETMTRDSLCKKCTSWSNPIQPCWKREKQIDALMAKFPGMGKHAIPRQAFPAYQNWQHEHGGLPMRPETQEVALRPLERDLPPISKSLLSAKLFKEPK
jgi:hypothetical protein